LAAGANINFDVNPVANWLGYINIFNQADVFQFGFPEGNLGTASGSFAPGPSEPLTLGPNTRLYDENILDPFWVDQGTFEATLVSEFNIYQEIFDADPVAFVGQTVDFAFETVANDLPAGYEAVGFIKVLDGFSSWSTYQIETVPLVAGQTEAISLVVNNSGITGGGTPFVQAGFSVKGAYVSSGDPVALTGVDIVDAIPEPASIGMIGLFAAGCYFIRRFFAS
jgi:hypothetical protein